MNDEEFFQNILKKVYQGRNLFFTGPGGTGKSYIIKKLAKQLTDNQYKVAVVAPTGVAAINLCQPLISASTIHKWSGIRGDFNMSPESIAEKLASDFTIVPKWRKTNLLIIDEVSMVGKKLLHQLDAIAKRIRNNARVFGGLQVIFSGDILQLPPVKDTFIFKSELFDEFDFVPIVFKIPKRYNDPDYYNMLLRIREGYQTAEDVAFLESRKDAYIEYLKTNAMDLLTVKPTRLYSLRSDTDLYNRQEIAKLCTPAFVSEGIDNIQIYKNKKSLYDFFLLQLDERIPKAIEYRVGAQVMLKLNIEVEANLANGSRGVVVDINSEYLTVKMLDGIEHQFKKEAFDYENDDGHAVRLQFPFILAWALTIHKAQGCTLDFVVGDCGGSVFSNGQAYVLLSRVRNGVGLFLIDFLPESIKVDQEALRKSIELETLAEMHDDEQEPEEQDPPPEYSSV